MKTKQLTPTAVEELRGKRLDLMKAGRAIAQKALDEGRLLTPSEDVQVKALIGEARGLLADEAKASDDQQLLDYIDESDRQLASGMKGKNFMNNGPGAAWGNAYAKKYGFKDAITPSGTLTVPALSAGIAELEDRPQSFLQAISFQSLDTRGFQFTRETLRDLQAKTVEPGKRKPTSDIELEPFEDHARTIAHLTNPIDRRTLSDSSEVQSFLSDVMRLGVMQALERVVLKGLASDPTTDDFNGILNTSGTMAQAFATSKLVTIRKALTKLTRARLTGPFLIVMNSNVWESLELLTSAEHFTLGDPGNPGRTLPVDSARQVLWGTRVAISEELDDDEAIVGDFSPTSIRIREREGVRIDWSDAIQIDLGASGGESASGFETNQLVMRAEGDYGLELRRPWAFVVCDLTA